MERESSESTIRVFLLRREPSSSARRGKAGGEDEESYLVYAGLRDGVYRILKMTRLQRRLHDQRARVV